MEQEQEQHSRTRKRRSGQTLTDAERVEAKAAFLRALAESCDVQASAKAAKVVRGTAYAWRREDAVFRAAWDQTLNDALDELEMVAVQRARDGSDVLAIFLLKAHRPERYRDQVKHEHSGPNGGPIPFSYESIIAEVTTGSGSDSDGER